MTTKEEFQEETTSCSKQQQVPGNDSVCEISSAKEGMNDGDLLLPGFHYEEKNQDPPLFASSFLNIDDNEICLEEKVALKQQEEVGSALHSSAQQDQVNNSDSTGGGGESGVVVDIRECVVRRSGTNKEEDSPQDQVDTGDEDVVVVIVGDSSSETKKEDSSLQIINDVVSGSEEEKEEEGLKEEGGREEGPTGATVTVVRALRDSSRQQQGEELNVMSLIPLTNEYPDALLLETTYENDDDVVIPPATTGYEEEGSVTVGALLMQTTTTTTTTTITTTPAAAAGGGTTRTRTQRRGIYRQVVMNEPLVDALSAVIEYQQAATGDAGPISSYPAVQENPPARRPAFTQDIGDDEMNDVVRLSISETSAINRHF